MLNGIQIIRIGAAVNAIALIMNHIAVGAPHYLTSFLMGMGCSLCLVGAGKRFLEILT